MTEANGTFEAVRQRLLQRRAELLGRAQRVSADMRHEVEALSPDWTEQAVQRDNDGVLATIGEAAADELRQLDAALEKLAARRYGLCESCGAPIEVRRLAAVPYALRCTRCVEVLSG